MPCGKAINSQDIEVSDISNRKIENIVIGKDFDSTEKTKQKNAFKLKGWKCVYSNRKKNFLKTQHTFILPNLLNIYAIVCVTKNVLYYYLTIQKTYWGGCRVAFGISELFT